MKPSLNQIDLYFITDRKLTKKTILDDVRAAIKAGVKVIQYRDKEAATKIMFEEAKKLGDELVVVLNNDNWLRFKKDILLCPRLIAKKLLSHSVLWIV